MGRESKRGTDTRLIGEGFASLYARYGEPFVGFFMRRVYDHQAALDLTAETFAQILLARRRFRGTTDAELESWIYAIARAQLARYRRKGRAERRALERLAIQTPTVTDDDLARIEELADLDHLRAAIRKGVDAIPERHREAIQLRIIEELPYSEVAERLGITEPNARARVSRGLRQLGAALTESQMKEVPA